MLKIKFTVRGDPRPKARPRIGKFGAYTPAATKKAEEAFLKSALKHRPKKPSPNPIKLDILFVKKLNKTKGKSRLYADKRPDVDNYAKLVMDAMDEWFWLDDSQVVDLHVKKLYGSPRRTEVSLEEIEEIEEV